MPGVLFLGWEADDAGEKGSYDPSCAAINGPYAAALRQNPHLRMQVGCG